VNRIRKNKGRSRLFPGLRRLGGALSGVVLLGAGTTAVSQDVIGSASVPASRHADNVAIITIEGPIDRYTALSVRRRIAQAEQAGADAVVIELDTPGGEVPAVLEICNDIKGSSIANTVAWIHPDAYSGGAIIALACAEIVVSDPSSFGDALPIQANPLTGVMSLPEAERQKFMSPLIAEVTNSARKHGYDEYLVQAIISRHIELWLVRDTATGRTMSIDESEYRALFDGEPVRSSPILPSAAVKPDNETTEPSPMASAPEPQALDPVVQDEDLFKPAGGTLSPIQAQVDQELTERTRRPTITSADRGEYELLGYVNDGAGPIVVTHDEMFTFGFASATINTDDELKDFFGAKSLLRFDQTWSERLVRFMTLLPVRGLLVVVFLLAVFVEMMSPGVAISGAVALVALVALLAPPYMIGMASWWEIMAILVGIALIFAEIFVLPGFGIFGVLGMVALLGGLIGTFVPDQQGKLFPDSAGAQSDLLYGVATLLMALVTTGIGMFLISKHFGSLPLLSRLVLSDNPDEEGRDDLFAAMERDEPEIEPGAIGTALTPLRPSGRVELDGRIIDVVAEVGYISEGTLVVVTSATGFRIVVESADRQA